MSYWNYRVVKELKHDLDGEHEEYSIREIYYDDENNIIAWTEPFELRWIPTDLSEPLIDFEDELGNVLIGTHQPVVDLNKLKTKFGRG